MSLEPSTVPGRDKRLEEVLLPYLQARDAGQAPDRQALLARHPDLAAELAAYFAKEELVDPLLAPVLDTPQAKRAQAPSGSNIRDFESVEEMGDGKGARPSDLPPNFAGYEILGKLGEGGMGVVYKARQVNLDRIVALKMMVAGAHADPDSLARFQVEGEAVARLRHPNIVEIYEVGNHEGCPFFSLEYVSGGDLARRLEGKPLRATDGAKIVETLARAVHAAHQKGIIHRDLKPLNILVAADGTLKVTDFGLAKLMDSSKGLTRTEQAPGTPSYMAPEQADKTKAIGPATDVYALGAILYELLTGRPPFLGSSPLKIIIQLLTEEPVPLRLFQPKLPRDLEIVCMKCLQKEPAQRYASAEALAEDLRLFQAEEPISARAPSLFEELKVFKKRKPVAFAINLVLGLFVILCAGFPLLFNVAHGEIGAIVWFCGATLIFLLRPGLGIFIVGGWLTSSFIAGLILKDSGLIDKAKGIALFTFSGIGAGRGAYLGLVSWLISRHWGRTIWDVLPGTFVGNIVVTIILVPAQLVVDPVGPMTPFLRVLMELASVCGAILGGLVWTAIQNRRDRRRSGNLEIAGQSAQQSQPARMGGLAPPTIDFVPGPRPIGAAGGARLGGDDRTAPPQGPGNESTGRLPNIAGFEMLKILGQGAMGVVFQARQVAANRLVALKMIRAGVHAGASARQRFQDEARAVARLQHPNIVQIYEMGECNGQPFFALEYVAGGSLANKLRGRPLKARKAAELVETLARAVQAAHEQGIIHRDLKPGNILLTENGQPKVTDFGLAKLLDDGPGQTATWAIMGTPSYMAPEQASGQTKTAGPAADIYALGAILYELLTGRPPFQGATELETFYQIRTQEPVPPRLLHSKVPRDLNAICLKCLEKKPGNRYDSAAALADDLGRFLCGEPTLARPRSLWKRLFIGNGQHEQGLRDVRRIALVIISLLVGVPASILAGILINWRLGFLALIWLGLAGLLGNDLRKPRKLAIMQAPSSRKQRQPDDGG